MPFILGILQLAHKKSDTGTSLCYDDVFYMQAQVAKKLGGNILNFFHKIQSHRLLASTVTVASPRQCAENRQMQSPLLD